MAWHMSAVLKLVAPSHRTPDEVRAEEIDWLLALRAVPRPGPGRGGGGHGRQRHRDEDSRRAPRRPGTQKTPAVQSSALVMAVSTGSSSRIDSGSTTSTFRRSGTPRTGP